MNGLKCCLRLSLICAFICFAMILIMPFVDINGAGISQICAYIAAGLFWLSLITEIVLIFISTRLRKAIGASNNDVPTKKRLIGLVTFFSSKEATVADIVMFAAVAAIAVILCLNIRTGWYVSLCTALLLLSFSAHCLLNGRNYRYYKTFKTSERSLSK